MTKVTFLGLGVMGFPMAGHLSKAYDVTVYNRTISKSEAWLKAYRGHAAFTPFKAVKNSDIVFACLGRDEDVREIALNQGAFAGMREGSVFVDHTTTSAELAKELSQKAKEHHISYLDAPVSGGQVGAENGTLAIMCGGDADAFQHVEPLMVYGKIIKWLGPSGFGQLSKMVNQICIAGLVQALSEGLAFGQKAGLDMTTVLEVISKGAAGSWQMENRGPTMLNNTFDFGFAVDWMRKDLGYCLDEAKRLGVSLPVTEMVDQFYQELQNSGAGRLDTSSLIKRLV